MQDIYKEAVMKDLLFNTGKGAVNVVSLYYIPTESKRNSDYNLTTMATKLHAKLAESAVPDFLKEGNTTNPNDELRLAIIKDIILTRRAKAEAIKEKSKTNTKLDYLKELKRKKEMETDEAMSMEDIDKAIAELK